MAERDPRAAQRQAATRAIGSFEPMVQRAVERALARVAERFTALALAPRLTATAFVVTAADEPFSDVDAAILKQQWDLAIPDILDATETVFRAALEQIARDYSVAVEAMNIEPYVQQYLREARNRLVMVGDDLWAAARQVIITGSLDGLSIDQIALLLVEAFGEHGVELDISRAIRIARTETVGAWNSGTYGAVLALPEELQPPYKSWLATFDTRTRDAHFEADGQTVPLGSPFMVGGEQMPYPGYPLASPGNVINCRCTPTFGYDPDAPSDEGRQYLSDERIAEIIEHFEERGIVRDSVVTAAGDGEHTSGMVALIPTEEDARRLAVDGGEDLGELHVTLAFLGEADDWTAEQRDQLVTALREADFPGPVAGDAFGVNHWNPASEDPCWVYAIGGADVDEAHGAVWDVLREVGGPAPDNHRPWVAHLTGGYTTDRGMLDAMVDRLGPVTFDRIRVAFGGENTDIPLTTDGGEAAVTADATTTGRVRRWSTPDDTALAFEDEQTGDGRVFAPGALYWDGDSWPLQYAPQMLGGHQGAVMAGPIDALIRDGGRIRGAGGLYVDIEAGAEAVDQLERGAPLGVSVDLDDVDVEVVDARPPEERADEDDGVILASLATLSVLDLGGGRWSIRAGEVREHTAAGAPAVASLKVLLTACGFSVTAAAGDPDAEDGAILFEEKSGEFLFRITRGRVRGATLVSMPAFSNARIVLNAAPEGEVVAAVVGDTDLPINDDRDHEWDGGAAASRVLASATDADGNVDADRLAKAFLYRDDDANPETLSAYKLGIADVIGDRLEIIARGVFAVAGVLQGGRGGVDIPDSDRDRIRSRVEDLYERLAEKFDDDTIVPPWDDDDDETASGFVRPDADTATRLVAEVWDYIREFGTPVRADEFASHANVGIPEARWALKRAGQWRKDEADGFEIPPMEVEASAWDEFRAMPAMPAAFFAEPTLEELGTDDGGFHYRNGRVWGWVAQKGICHDGYTDQCLRIDDFGTFDLTTFLRATIDLDNGDEVAVGVFTMNTGHRNDGASVRHMQAQFDDTRTVAGIVTVGLNSRGLWFSGTAAPWLSEWDLAVFNTCRPSGHWKQERNGRWSLRAVLSVPVPGYPNRLAASAFVHRSNMALAASAGTTMPGGTVEYETELVASVGVFEPDSDGMRHLASAIVDEMERRAEARQIVEELSAQIDDVRTELVASMRNATLQEV